MEILIKRNALLAALETAKNAQPNEFICLFKGEAGKEKIVLESTIIPPGIAVNERMSSFSDWMMPIIYDIVGSFHSHPNGVLLPSKQDRFMFSRKPGIHIIGVPPFTEKSVAAYASNGKRVQFRVIG